jgi:hypothetical protein
MKKFVVAVGLPLKAQQLRLEPAVLLGAGKCATGLPVDSCPAGGDFYKEGVI